MCLNYVTVPSRAFTFSGDKKIALGFSWMLEDKEPTVQDTAGQGVFQEVWDLFFGKRKPWRICSVVFQKNLSVHSERDKLEEARLKARRPLRRLFKSLGHQLLL